MKKASAKILSILLVSVIALSALGSNRVLCVGSTGHLRLEIGDAEGRCPSAGDHEQPSRSRVENGIFFGDNEEPCCSRCVDIPIPAANLEDTLLRSARSAVSRDDVRLSTFNFDFFPYPKTSSPIVRFPSFDPGSAVRLIATIVLLI